MKMMQSSEHATAATLVRGQRQPVPAICRWDRTVLVPGLAEPPKRENKEAQKAAEPRRIARRSKIY